MGVWLGNAQGPHSRQRARGRAARAQPDDGAHGRGGRLQGGLSLGRVARLGQMRHRGQSDAAGTGRGRGRHARGLQAADRARRRRRLGRSGAYPPHRRAGGSRGLRRDRDRGPAAAAADGAPRRHRPSRAQRILPQEAQGSAGGAHRSEPPDHRAHQCAARRRHRGGGAARRDLPEGRRRHGVLLHAQPRGAALRGRAGARRR